MPLHWLSPGDNSWQLTAATLVGLMSVPGLVVLYGGVMQKRWSVNSMMMAFIAFALVLIVWVLWGFKMGFGSPIHLFGSKTSFWNNLWGNPGSILTSHDLRTQGVIPNLGAAGKMVFPQSTLAYFQFVFAAITPILALGSVLGRFNFKAWIPFVVIWASLVYTINAFLIWGGGFFAQHGALDFSGGYVIHLSAGVAGFVAAAVVRHASVDCGNTSLPAAPRFGMTPCVRRSWLVRIEPGLPHRLFQNEVFDPAMCIGDPKPILKPHKTQTINTSANATNDIIIEFTDQRFCITPP